MTRIYTRTGDKGETGLFGGGRVSKGDDRVEAYGEVDELNACLGLALSFDAPDAMRAELSRIQEELFTLGAVLATPKGAATEAHIPKVEPSWGGRMEKLMDTYAELLPPMTHFILPGGSRAAAALHVARTVCRRAERSVVRLSQKSAVDADVLVYLNRLSDLLFMMARAANQAAGVQDVLWIPKKPK
ncbi:MAG: cob(I)yrinic acid a,c-diamide adenosyltransferase [Myxococcaceae bacterium]